MSFCYGPIVLPGLGQITSTTISQQSSSLIIENQSLFDVLFSVQVAQPQALTQAQVNAIVGAGGAITTGGWDLHIGPRNFGVLELNAGDLTQSPAGGYWSGTVWILQASLPNVKTTAGSFVSDPGPNIWITAYGPGEKLPDPGISSLGYFLASQERVVAVPVVPSVLFDAVSSNATQSVWATAATVGIGNFPFSNQGITAGITGPGNVTGLLYSCVISMLPLSGVAGVAEGQDVILRYAVLDSSSTIQGTTGTMFRSWFSHLSYQSLAVVSISHSTPTAFGFTVSPGSGPPYTLALQVFIDAAFGGGGTNIKRMVIEVTGDLTPNAPDGAGGGLNGLTQGSTYNGFVY